MVRNNGDRNPTRSAVESLPAVQRVSYSDARSYTLLTTGRCAVKFSHATLKTVIKNMINLLTATKSKSMSFFQ